MESTTCKEDTPKIPPVLDPPSKTEEFIQERRYLKNVTTKTIAWYEQSFKAFDGALDSKQAINQRIVSLRERGVSPISINSWLRCINAYLRWTGSDLKIPRLQEEKKILRTLTSDDVKRLIEHKTKSKSQSRIQSLAVLLLDTGLRIAEILQPTATDIDLDNFLIRVQGKGRKERLVPFSIAGRKVLYKLCRNGGYLFPTPNGTLSIRNAQRDLTKLCIRAGIKGVRCSPHTLRHSFSVHYLKRGGNVEYLRRILGHSSVTTTQRYLQSIQPTDLQKIHNELSPLGRSI
jgi:integrase/recombinase XerD